MEINRPGEFWLGKRGPALWGPGTNSGNYQTMGRDPPIRRGKMNWKNVWRCRSLRYSTNNAHGSFRAYQYHLRLYMKEMCPTYPMTVEDAEHAFFQCHALGIGDKRCKPSLICRLCLTNLMLLWLTGKWPQRLRQKYCEVWDRKNEKEDEELHS